MNKLPIVPALAFALVAAVCAFALAGCAGNAASSEASGSSNAQGSSSAGATASSQDLFGYWQLSSDSSIGVGAYLRLADTGAAEFVIGDSYYAGTWKVENSEALLILEGESAVKLSYDGSKLWMGDSDASRLVFEKSEGDSNKAKHEVESMRGAGVTSTATSSSTDPQASSGASGDITVVDEVFEDIAPVAIADDATCSITVTAKGTDFTGDPSYRLSVANKTDKALYFTAEKPFTVGGKSIDAGLGDSVDPGETIDITMYFDHEELGGGVELLADVTGTINVEDDATESAIADYPFHMD